jgi:hypothetical protein
MIASSGLDLAFFLLSAASDGSLIMTLRPRAQTIVLVFSIYTASAVDAVADSKCNLSERDTLD